MLTNVKLSCVVVTNISTQWVRKTEVYFLLMLHVHYRLALGLPLGTGLKEQLISETLLLQGSQERVANGGSVPWLLRLVLENDVLRLLAFPWLSVVSAFWGRRNSPTRSGREYLRRS